MNMKLPFRRPEEDNSFEQEFYKKVVVFDFDDKNPAHDASHHFQDHCW